MADNIAYLQLKNRSISNRFLNFDYKKFYRKNVFFCPLWEEIYTQDKQRLQSFEEVKKLEQLLINTYKKLDFKILLVSKTLVTERLKFVMTTFK